MPLIITPKPQNNVLEKIGTAISIYKQIAGSPLEEIALEKARAEAADAQRTRDLHANLVDPSSAESAQAREQYKGYGLPVQDTESASALERRLGKTSEYAQKKFEAETKKELDPFTARTKGLDFQIKQLELAKKNQEVKEGSNKRDFNSLPVENQEQIRKISASNANKKAIRNQLSATLETLKNPQVAYEQKFMAAKNLGKTLNSTEGSDAVGEGEADRMLSFLNQLPLNRPGFDFGPQLDKFTDQVALKVRDIDQAVLSNQDNIDQLYGRSPQMVSVNIPEMETGKKSKSSLIPEANAGQGKMTAEDVQAFQWAKANPRDQRSAAILNSLKLKGLK